MGWTRASIMENIQEQVRHRTAQKYNWKRIPHGALEKLQRKFFRTVFLRSRFRVVRNSANQRIDLGIDDLGRDIALGLKEYVNLLLSRGVKLHTLLVLGSRVKGRGKSESDVDVMIIASELPGRSMDELTNFPQKILGIRRWLLLMDAPLFMGIQPSGCCSKEEFLGWLKEFKIQALDAIYYGRIIYDDGFWKYVQSTFKEIEERYGLEKKELKRILLSL